VVVVVVLQPLHLSLGHLVVLVLSFFRYPKSFHNHDWCRLDWLYTTSGAILKLQRLQLELEM
jgi:hypothetical protein